MVSESGSFAADQQHKEVKHLLDYYLVPVSARVCDFSWIYVVDFADTDPDHVRLCSAQPRVPRLDSCTACSGRAVTVLAYIVV